MSKNTIIYNAHSWDGIFCREVALKALREKPNVAVLSWEPGDPALEFPDEGHVYVLGLPLDTPFGSQEPYDCESNWHRLTWIHNHPDAIRNTEAAVPGFRLARVVNCRLAYSFFFSQEGPPSVGDFLTNEVNEPYSLKLVQDKPTNVRVLTAGFFRGLSRLQRQPDWNLLLSEELAVSLPYVNALVQLGGLHPYQQGEPAERPAFEFFARGKGGREDVQPVKDKACEAGGLTSACPTCDHRPLTCDWDGTTRCEACGWKASRRETWGMGRPSVQACPIVMDTWPIKDEPARSVGTTDSSKLQGCGVGHCAICGATHTPLHQVDYADKPIWICLGGCRQAAKQTVDEVVCEQGRQIRNSPLYGELIQWLDQQHITSDSIGSIRRRVLLPWATEWNEIVREQTAAREHSLS